MAKILLIDTSTEVCLVALSENNQVIASRIDTNGQNHSKLIGTFVQDILQEVGITAQALDAVALSAGPGSYTGLRIGTSFVKGLCFGVNIPVITLPTLQILAQEALLQQPSIAENAHLCPMIDARRMEVYTAVYTTQLAEKTAAWPEIVTEASFATYLEQPTYFFGNGSDKCKDVISHPNAHFIDNIKPLAKNMCPLAEKAIANEQYADVAYFEPLYLKDFVATKAKKLI
jgi:tRNA threonylcarbamoyladenosine biosynthesis protein TsaB